MGPMPGTMHAHGGHAAMGMAVLPTWLRVTWVVALGIVVVLHVWHAAARCDRQHRWWHAAHVVMGLGMITMYLFMMTAPTVSWVTLAAFAALTVALIAIAIGWRRREGVLNPLWVATALDALLMVYMSLPSAARPTVLTWVFVAYLCAQALAWTFRLWGRLPLYAADTIASAAPPAGAVAAAGGPGAATATRHQPQVGLNGHITIDVAMTLAVMAASMAYMLAAM